MKKWMLFLFSGMCFLSPLSSLHAETLEEIWLYAYKTNPELEASRAYLKAAVEYINMAESDFLPTLAAEGSYGIQRQKNALIGVPATHDESLPATGRISASQNLFSGFGSLAKYRGAKENVKIAEYAVTEVEQNVLLNAGTSYLDVLTKQAMLDLQKNNEDILAKHLESYRQKFKVGVLTRTDIDQSVSRLERAKAARIAAEGELSTAQATYKRVIGKDPVKLVAMPTSRFGVLVPPELDDAINRSYNSNPALLQSLHASRAAQEEISVAESGHYPTLDLGAYATKSLGDTRSDDFSRPFSDTYYAGVTLTVPLYTGGATQASVRQAKGLAAQARLNYVDAKRRITENVTTAYHNYKTSIAQIDAIEAQIKAARSALNGVTREAQVGSRTILDILDAQQELLNAEVALVEAKRNAGVAAMSLYSAMGTLTKEGLKLKD